MLCNLVSLQLNEAPAKSENPSESVSSPSESDILFPAFSEVSRVWFSKFLRFSKAVLVGERKAFLVPDISGHPYAFSRYLGRETEGFLALEFSKDFKDFYGSFGRGTDGFLGFDVFGR